MASPKNSLFSDPKPSLLQKKEAPGGSVRARHRQAFSFARMAGKKLLHCGRNAPP
jgi:hypothetical protein